MYWIKKVAKKYKVKKDLCVKKYNDKLFIIFASNFIGDTLILNGLVQNIKENFYDAKVVFVVPKYLYPIAKYQYQVDDVIIFDNKKKNNLSYIVSSIFSIPLPENSVSTVINMFAPVAYSEFIRIMKSGATLIVGVAGKTHLDGLKNILYSDVYENEESTDKYDGFEFTECRNLKYEAKIVGNDTIKNLFTMTPYYFRTSFDDKKKLDNIEELSTHIEVNFYIYEKI